MIYLDKTSLAKTIDNVSEALLFGFDINEREKLEIADFIIKQHGTPYSYANTFAPTDEDMKRDLILFTGEKIKSKAGKCHTLGEEASRILRKLKIEDQRIHIALRESDEGLQKRIDDHLTRQDGTFGAYCCKTCSCSLWLNLSAGGLNNNIQMQLAGLNFLKLFRNDEGSWNGFPYYYTLYALNEISSVLAIDELRFAASSIGKRLKRRISNENQYTLRRNFICESILKKVS
jgi:hypothetical protein